MRPLLVPSIALAVLLAGPTEAVIIDSGDGTGNTAAPSPDPGWSSLGTRNGDLTVIYIGNGWVLTANHVGVDAAVFGGTAHPVVPGSKVQLPTPNSGGGFADLMVYKIQGDPGVPPAEIAATTPSNGTSVVMAGRGRDRGGATSWMGVDGWSWAGTQTPRWGMNVVFDDDELATVGYTTTQSFVTRFDAGLPTAHEAQAALGDSGGAVWVDEGGGGNNWKLAGVIYTIAGFLDQPLDAALYGNDTYIADLATYRDAILAIVETPDCSNGLDDDGDGLIDLQDAACLDPLDASEQNPGLICDDGIDNDGDGATDWPADSGCAHPYDYAELHACTDGYDNDGDGLADYGVDPGCFWPNWHEEAPACDDGIDNDGDGATDWDGDPPDSVCLGKPWRDREWGSNGRCGLGWEIAVVLVPFARSRFRTPRRKEPLRQIA